MHLHRGNFPVRLMARILSVSSSGYYAWCKRPPSADADGEVLLCAISTAFLESKRTYGSPRVYGEVKSLGFKCGENRVAEIMRAHGMRAKMKRLPFFKTKKCKKA